MDINSFLTGIAATALFFLIFTLGVAVGEKRADFAFRWADQYHRIFGGPSSGFFDDFLGTSQNPNSHGSYGEIIKISKTDIGKIIFIKDISNIEKIILADGNCAVVFQRDRLLLDDLKVGDMVVVIGNPNNVGQIQAQLIRVVPSENIKIKIIRRGELKEIIWQN